MVIATFVFEVWESFAINKEQYVFIIMRTRHIW